MQYEINWTAGNGTAVRVTVELESSKVIDVDGQKVSVKTCEIKVAGYANGELMGTCFAGFIHPKLKDLGVVAMIGKIAIKKENLDKIEAAITACENTPEYIAHAKKIAENAAEVAEYEIKRNKMRKVMGY